MRVRHSPQLSWHGQTLLLAVCCCGLWWPTNSSIVETTRTTAATPTELITIGTQQISPTHKAETFATFRVHIVNATTGAVRSRPTAGGAQCPVRAP